MKHLPGGGEYPGLRSSRPRSRFGDLSCAHSMYKPPRNRPDGHKHVCARGVSHSGEAAIDALRRISLAGGRQQGKGPVKLIRALQSPGFAAVTGTRPRA